MSGIEDLQQRVILAEERFGLANAERAKYSDRLMSLIDAIETRLGDQQAEIERQAGESASQIEEMETLRLMAGENKLLRSMIQSLLNAIELGNDMALGETMQALETKISILIDDACPKTAEAAPSEAEAPEIEAAETAVDESAGPELEAAADESPGAPEIETADTPEEESAAPEPEVIAEANVEAADDVGAAEESQPEPVTEPEAETGAPEVLDIPAGDAEVSMIDEEIALDAAGDGAPPAADAVEGNLVDEADAVLEVPAAETGGPKPEASSLEDIMRRVSKLVEDEGSGGAKADAGEPSPQAKSAASA